MRKVISLRRSIFRHLYHKAKGTFFSYPIESGIGIFWFVCMIYALVFRLFEERPLCLPVSQIANDCVRCSSTVQSASRSLRLAITAGQRGRRGDSMDDIALIYSPWNEKTGTIDELKFTNQVSPSDNERMQLNYIPSSLCPNSPPNLNEKVPISTVINDSLLELLPQSQSILPGGFYHPPYCLSTITTNIIVPFRARENQLKLFLQHMHQFLPPQMINYQIFVIEQVDEFPFNRGKLMNVGYFESLNLNPSACCFIFHDVDLLPEDQRNIYSCSLSGPRHVCASINEFRYKLLYSSLFGGAVAISRGDFKDIHGFANIYYGWGGEDDDLSARVAQANKTIARWSDVSKCFMLSHKKEHKSSVANTLLETASERFHSDGLSTLNYRVKRIKREALYTRISVQL